jgi:small subunit ribosomal protein S3
LGQKVHPYGFRLGYNNTWKSRWYAGKDYVDKLHEDLKLRNYLKKRLYHAGIASVEVERAADKMTVNIFTARPGIIIGKKGSEVDKLKSDLQKMLNRKEVFVNIEQVNNPEANAQLVAEQIASLLERRVAFRKAMKKAIENALRKGVEGIKIKVSGRLGGADIARSEEYSQGRIPLSTLKADIDYGVAESMTTYGVIGVKVWINKGEKVPQKGVRRSKR